MNELVPVQRLDRAKSIPNLLQEFIESELIGVSQPVKDTLRREVGRLVIFAGKDGLAPDVFGKFANSLYGNGANPATINKILVYNRRFFSWCFKMGYTATRWHEFIPRVAVTKPALPDIIQYEEYLRLRECAIDEECDWVMVLGYSTGLRLTDCCTMCWSQIDQGKQLVRSIPSKTRRKTGVEVVIPYMSGGDLHKLIIDRWAKKDEGIQLHKDFISPVMASRSQSGDEHKRFRIIFDKAGLPNKSFKHFRSTFESRLANSGMNAALAAKITGRSDTRTILRYVRPDMEVVREGVAKALELHNHVEGFK